MRIGSGGVMLPNHAPLVVAEQFGMLEALHPGRIDLGIGRAPGTDQITAAALRRSAEPLSDDDFPRQLTELIGFFKGEFSERPTPTATSRPCPATGDLPEIWLLGSCGYSGAARRHARAAASRSPTTSCRSNTDAGARALPPALPALRVARRAVRDGRRAPRSAPRTTSGRATCSGPRASRWRACAPGRPSRFPTPEEAAAHEFTASEEASVKPLSGSAVIGGPETVRDKLDDLAERTAADELMITTMVHDHADRIRSYELIADAYDRVP